MRGFRTSGSVEARRGKFPSLPDRATLLARSVSRAFESASTRRRKPTNTPNPHHIAATWTALSACDLPQFVAPIAAYVFPHFCILHSAFCIIISALLQLPNAIA